MRKLLQYLFPIAALTLALMGSSKAEAPEVCKGCQITETELRAFIARAEHEITASDLRAWQAEHKADSCMALLKGKTT